MVAPANTTEPYDRSDWPHWSGSCPDVRGQVLIRDTEITATMREDGCLVLTGRWTDPWTKQVYTVAAEIDIDHTVALANAHRSGGWAWNREQRRAFANDLDNPDALRTMGRSANIAKSDNGPEAWKPPALEAWCEFATDWATVKIRWSLTVTPPERVALEEMVQTC